MNRLAWRSTQLGQVCEKPQYGYTASAQRNPIGPKFLRITDLREGRIDWDSVPFCELTDEELARYRLRHGDILVARIGATTGNTSIVIDPPNSVFASYLIRLRANDEAHPFFLYFYTMDAQFRNWIDAHKDSNLKGGVNVPVLLAAPLALPTADEQEKIATVLWKLQRAIATQDRLIATTRDLKQSAMHRFFTQGLRGEPLKESEIGLMPESWHPTPIKELREFLQYGTSSKCGYHHQGRPVIRIPNIVDGRVDTNDIKWAELTAKEIASYELASGDILFIRTNGVIDRVGSCSVFRDELPGALFASYLIRARPNERLHPEFFQYYSMTAQGRAQLAGRGSPAADGKFNINTPAIDSVLVPLPRDKDEQLRIAAALTTIDRKLAHHQKKRAALNDLFQTLLHKLMTGEIRLADIDIDTSEITASSKAST